MKNRRRNLPPCWLVLSAWEPELAELRRVLPELPGLRERVALRATGVGLVEAAVGATRAIAEVEPDAVLLVGTAGLYPGRRSELRATSVVATRRLVLLDRSVVCGEAYLPAALPASTRAATGLCRRAAAQGILLADVACPLGIGSRAAGRIARALECDVENLEAFAVARAAEVAGVPFTGLLGISNRVGSGAHAGWRRNARRAGAAACRAALGMLGG